VKLSFTRGTSGGEAKYGFAKQFLRLLGRISQEAPLKGRKKENIYVLADASNYRFLRRLSFQSPDRLNGEHFLSS
jgi:hypothetical protein